MTDILFIVQSAERLLESLIEKILHLSKGSMSACIIETYNEPWAPRSLQVNNKFGGLIFQ